MFDIGSVSSRFPQRRVRVEPPSFPHSSAPPKLTLLVEHIPRAGGRYRGAGRRFEGLSLSKFASAPFDQLKGTSWSKARRPDTRVPGRPSCSLLQIAS